jgi:hypothetical protein
VEEGLSGSKVEEAVEAYSLSDIFRGTHALEFIGNDYLESPGRNP